MVLVVMGILLSIGTDLIGEWRTDMITLQWTIERVITIPSSTCTFASDLNHLIWVMIVMSI